MAGRRPLPTTTKLLSGKRHRPLNANEPKFSGTPTCPKHLSKAAKAEWKRLASDLSAQGLLTNVDRAALAAYCAAWARWIDAEDNITKQGVVILSPKSGYPIQSPYIGIANTALDQMRKFAVEFGMTPSSRSRISASADGNKDADPFTAFMESIGGTETPDESEQPIVQ